MRHTLYTCTKIDSVSIKPDVKNNLDLLLPETNIEDITGQLSVSVEPGISFQIKSI